MIPTGESTTYDDFRQQWAPKVLSIPGHLQPGQEEWLYRAAQGVPGNVILEIGAYKGRSTACLAAACVGTNRRVWTIDPFTAHQYNTNDLSGPNFFHEFYDNLVRVGLDGYVHALVGLSSDYYRQWALPIDFLWIDGSHEYGVVKADFDAFWPWLVPGGLLAMHDVSHGDYGGIVGPDKVWAAAEPGLLRTGHFGSIAYGFKPA